MKQMNKILFVGDKPSSKNIDANQAFLGTQSHKRLLRLIIPFDGKFNIDYGNSHTEQLIEEIKKWSEG